MSSTTDNLDWNNYFRTRLDPHGSTTKARRRFGNGVVDEVKISSNEKGYCGPDNPVWQRHIYTDDGGIYEYSMYKQKNPRVYTVEELLTSEDRTVRDVAKKAIEAKK